MAIQVYHCLDSITFSFDSRMFISHAKFIIYKEYYKTKALNVQLGTKKELSAPLKQVGGDYILRVM